MFMLALSRLPLLAALALSACGASRSADSAHHAPEAGTHIVATSASGTSGDCEDDARSYHNRGVRLCETRTLALSGRRLTLNASPNGGIEVRPWNGNGIEVTARVEAWAETDAEARTLLREAEVDVRDHTVRTRLPEHDDDREGWVSVSYDIRVPHEADLDLSATNGGIHVAGVDGSLRLRSVNGGLALDRVAGRIEGETINGPVNVDLERAPTRGIDLTTMNGPVTLVVPDGLSAEVDAETSIGPVRIDGLPLEDAACTDRDTRYVPCLNGRVVGTLGRGGPTVRLRTTNGPISLKRR